MTLRALRERRGLSLRDVEGKSGISRGRLSEIERGMAFPSSAQLVKLSGLYGVDPSRWSARIQYVYTEESG